MKLQSVPSKEAQDAPHVNFATADVRKIFKIAKVLTCNCLMWRLSSALIRSTWSGRSVLGLEQHRFCLAFLLIIKLNLACFWHGCLNPTENKCSINDEEASIILMDCLTIDQTPPPFEDLESSMIEREDGSGYLSALVVTGLPSVVWFVV